MMIASLISTCIVYFISIIVFQETLSVSFILNDNTWLIIISLTLISWIPFYFYKKIKGCVAPSRLQKLQDLKKKETYEIIDDKVDNRSKLLS